MHRGWPKKVKRAAGRKTKTLQNVVENRCIVGSDTVGGGQLVAIVWVLDGDGDEDYLGMPALPDDASAEIKL